MKLDLSEKDLLFEGALRESELIPPQPYQSQRHAFGPILPNGERNCKNSVNRSVCYSLVMML